jgi:hypothetical protein
LLLVSLTEANEMPIRQIDDYQLYKQYRGDCFSLYLVKARKISLNKMTKVKEDGKPACRQAGRDPLFSIKVICLANA